MILTPLYPIPNPLVPPPHLIQEFRFQVKQAYQVMLRLCAEDLVEHCSDVLLESPRVETLAANPGTLT